MSICSDLFGNLRKEGRDREAARGKSKESSGVNIKCFTRVKVLRYKYSFD